MTRHIDSDRALEDWLAEGPNQLPGRVIDGIVRQLDETPQRKHWWLPRREQMNRTIFALGGAAAAVVVAVLALGVYYNQPGVGGQPTEPAGVLYTSERHGYSLLLPDETWTVAEQPGTWALGQTFNQDGPGVDSVLREAGGPRTFILVNSQPVPDGTTLGTWVIGYDSAGRRSFPDCRVERTESAVLDGETARLNTYLCATDAANEAVTLHGGRAYAIRVFNGADRDVDPRTIIDEWLARFRFTD